MALAMDQQQQHQQQYHDHDHHQPIKFKHYCRVCNKGFGCGRALGGHMRAHGLITDVDDDHDSCDQTNNSGAFKRMYALRPNTTRLKTCRVCHNCGKEFLSWKLFLDHATCNTNEHHDHNNHVGCDDDDDDDDDDRQWAKGKRSRRTMRMGVASAASTREEEDLAHCLVMLSAARVEPVVVVVEPEESCASASRDADDVNRAAAVPRGVFECKACKKVFNSHQALGGHRASHKKVKGCFAGQADQEMVIMSSTHEENKASIINSTMSIMPLEEEAVLPLRKKGKVHECSICHRVFSSGQALGGHKRCHWITSNSGEPAKVLHMNLNHQQQQQLDLNLPHVLRPEEDIGLTSSTRLRLDIMPAEIFLQAPWMEEEKWKKKKKMKSINQDQMDDDEADSKIKLAKLSELKDVNMSGESSSSWLQVGIGSSTNDTCSDP